MDDQVQNDDAQQVQDDQTVVEPQVDANDTAQAEPAPQPTVEPDATADRFKQDNAALRATLQKLGIDPDSTDAENIRNGYVDPKEIIAAKFGIQQQPVQPTAEPEQSAEEITNKIDSILRSVEGRAINVDEYQKLERLKLDLNKKLLAENKTLKAQREQDQQQRDYQDCMNACRTTYQSDDVFKNLPTDAQQKAASFIESIADVRVGNLARQIGWENAAKPQVMQQETAKAVQEFHGLVQALSGQKAAPQQPTNVAPVVPMGSGPGQPISTPRPPMRLEDLQSNTDRYLAAQAGQV